VTIVTIIFNHTQEHYFFFFSHSSIAQLEFAQCCELNTTSRTSVGGTDFMKNLRLPNVDVVFDGTDVISDNKLFVSYYDGKARIECDMLVHALFLYQVNVIMS